MALGFVIDGSWAAEPGYIGNRVGVVTIALGLTIRVFDHNTLNV